MVQENYNQNQWENEYEDDEPDSKRHRADTTTLANYDDDDGIRTSSLSSPTLKLSGHTGSVYGLAYSPDKGSWMVSCSFDKTCLLWDATDNYKNIDVLSGHANAVLDVGFLQPSIVVTASADTTGAVYDITTGQRLHQKLPHDGQIVNALSTSSFDPHCWTTACDDGQVRLWDVRTKCRRQGPVHTFAADDDTTTPMTAVAYSAQHQTIYTGGIDNHIHVFDIRSSNNRIMTMKGHDDTITSLSLHPQHELELLSHSMDATIRSWNVRPSHEHKTRHLKTFEGAKVNSEKGLLRCSWKADGSMITGGSSDKMVHIWDEFTSQTLYSLPGHIGCVNSVIFHPTENIIASASSDKTIYVGELG